MFWEGYRGDRGEFSLLKLNENILLHEIKTNMTAEKTKYIFVASELTEIKIKVICGHFILFMVYYS